MTALDQQVNSAVMQIRRQVNGARHRLGQKSVSYAGVPTVHTCDARPYIGCDACAGRNASV